MERLPLTPLPVCPRIADINAHLSVAGLSSSPGRAHYRDNGQSSTVRSSITGGMSSSVDLMKGYKLTSKVLRKLKNEFNVQYLCIHDPSMQNVEFHEAIEEAERQSIVEAIVRNMSEVKKSNIINLKKLGDVVGQIISDVTEMIRKAKGNIRSLSKTLVQVQSHDTYTWEHSVNSARKLRFGAIP